MAEYEEDKSQLDYLIQSAIEIGNLLVGKDYIRTVPDLIYAEGLGKKIILHTLSARLLYEGYSMSAGRINSVPNIDFASINVLTRAAVETYLTLNYIYVNPKSDSEKEFKFMCWDLGGYLERSKFPTASEAHQKIKESEAKVILELKKKIKCHPFFKTIPADYQGQPLGGQWKLGNSWTNIAVGAGYSEPYFNKQYKFLCGYAHSSRLSIIQIRDSKNIENEIQMASPTIGLLMTVISKFIYDYIHIFPEIGKQVDLNSSKYALVKMWKEIGEEFDREK